MKRNLVLLTLSAALLLLSLSACGSGAPRVDWELRVTGAVSDPLTLSYQDLARRDMVTLEDVVMSRSQGEDTINTWEGPAVAPILEEAGISASATAVLCTASDGYAREMTRADLEEAIIAVKMDGEWIASGDNGPIRIVVPNKPGNFWLYELVEMEVVE